MNLTVTSQKQTARFPTPISTRLSETISKLRVALQPEGPEEFSVDRFLAATPDQRQALQARVTEIDDWLKPAGEAFAEAEIASVLGTMGMRPGNEDDQSVILRIYVADMCDQPAFSVRHACTAARRGEIGNGRFVPTIAELRKSAIDHCLRYERERAEINRILCAKITARRDDPKDQSAADRVARIARETKQLLDQTTRAMGVEKRSRPLSEMTAPEADSKLAHLAGVATKPLTISPGLAQKLEAEKHRMAAAAE